MIHSGTPDVSVVIRWSPGKPTIQMIWRRKCRIIVRILETITVLVLLLMIGALATAGADDNSATADAAVADAASKAAADLDAIAQKFTLTYSTMYQLAKNHATTLSYEDGIAAQKIADMAFDEQIACGDCHDVIVAIAVLMEATPTRAAQVAVKSLLVNLHSKRSLFGVAVLMANDVSKQTGDPGIKEACRSLVNDSNQAIEILKHALP